MTILNPWSRATPVGTAVGVGYLTIVNNADRPDRLVRGSARVAAGFELHETRVENGIARMRPIAGGLVIPPRETVKLAPNGAHIMLTGLTRPLKQGERVDATLVFETAGGVDVEFSVEGLGSSGPSRSHYGSGK